MRIVRESFVLMGAFFVVAGILLTVFGPSHGFGAALPFGLIYAGAGAGMIVFSFVPQNLR